MASCVKCTNYKQLNEIITIKKDSNRKLYETLFKDVDATQLTICKTCFGEIAEFLDEEDFIDEIPVSWMQDDNDTIKLEAVEQEIKRYDIVAFSKFSNEDQKSNSQNDQELILKKAKVKSILASYIINKAKKSTVTSELSKDIPTFVLSEDSNSLNFEHTFKSQNYDSITENKVKSPGTACYEILSDDSESAEIVCDMRSSNVHGNSNEDNFANQCAPLEPGTKHEEVAKSNSFCSENLIDSNSLILDEITQQEEVYMNNENMKYIPTYEIDDDSDDDSSVHFIDEVRFLPPENIAEESVESVDFKEDVEVLETPTDCSATTLQDESQMTVVENDKESCSTAEQMRLLDEFEKQCEVIEQGLAESQQTQTEVPDHIIESDHIMTDGGDSSNCHTIRFNAHYSNEQEAFLCSTCGQITDQMWKMQEHITFADLNSDCKNARIEKQKLEHGICCEYCGFFYRHPADLQAHRATGIHSDLLFTCPECRQCFKDFAALSKHSRTHATPKLKFSPMFLCNVGNCVKMCLNWSLLSKHKDLSHVAQICPICREVFHDGRFFATHVKNCKKDAIMCNHCFKTFPISKSHAIIRHRRTCANSSFQCNACGMRFKDNDSLSRHNIMKHQPIDCGKCGKVFKNKRSMLSHTRRSVC